VTDSAQLEWVSGWLFPSDALAVRLQSATRPQSPFGLERHFSPFLTKSIKAFSESIPGESGTVDTSEADRHASAITVAGYHVSTRENC
jgi:hypothetical protein